MENRYDGRTDWPHRSNPSPEGRDHPRPDSSAGLTPSRRRPVVGFAVEMDVGLLTRRQMALGFVWQISDW